ncbi:MAG: GNAT family N-acetyltransferase [Myxococcales bacterium]
MAANETPPSELRIVPAQGEGDIASALAIREIVFIEEQRVPQGLERDAEDAKAFHVLAYDGKHAIGTGRLVALGKPPQGERGKWGQIGRVAVLATYRRRGVGRQMLQALEDEAKRRKLEGVVLFSQLYARDFYRALGFHDASPIFEESGIPHVEMRKPLWIQPPSGPAEVF